MQFSINCAHKMVQTDKIVLFEHGLEWSVTLWSIAKAFFSNKSLNYTVTWLQRVETESAWRKREKLHFSWCKWTELFLMLHNMFTAVLWSFCYTPVTSINPYSRCNDIILVILMCVFILMSNMFSWEWRKQTVLYFFNPSMHFSLFQDLENIESL